jgi:signal transduction histidine kinase
VCDSLARWSVVVVDDLADLRKVLRLILEHGGPYKVVGEGASGEDAVALAADLHPDVLLMDVEMPGGSSGWDVLPRINEVAPETAVVILSGSRGEVPGPGGGGGRTAAVLEKGLGPDELHAALRTVLGAGAPGPAAPAPAAAAVVGPDDVGAANPAPAAVGGDAAVARFASVAGHDLAQPMQVAYGYLEMLRADYGAGLDPTAAQWLEAALGSLERMRTLVQALLAYARSDTRPLRPVPVALGAAVDAAVAEVGDLGGLAVVVERDGLPAVVTSEPELVDVLARLVANAVAHAASTVRIAATATDGADGAGDVVVTVEDDGPGVPEALRDRVFEPFERGGPHAGAGLGLATARRLVERLGGRLWLEPSAPTRFRFSIPAPLT